MSEDKHFPPPAPVPEALQDHEPTDRAAAKGIVYVILAVFVISLIVFTVIYSRGQENDAPLDGAAPTERVR